MAPELFRLSDTTGSMTDFMAADVWAVGEIAFRLLTGTEAFRTTQHNQDNVNNYVRDPRLFPEKVLKKNKVSEVGIQFIRSAMAPRPQDRFPANVAINHFWIRDHAKYPAQSELMSEFDDSSAAFSVREPKHPQKLLKPPPNVSQNGAYSLSSVPGSFRSLDFPPPSGQWTPASHQIDSSSGPPNAAAHQTPTTGFVVNRKPLPPGAAPHVPQYQMMGANGAGPSPKTSSAPAPVHTPEARPAPVPASPGIL